MEAKVWVRLLNRSLALHHPQIQQHSYLLKFKTAPEPPAGKLSIWISHTRGEVCWNIFHEHLIVPLGFCTVL